LPKIKTHKTSAKRFKITSSGKILRRKQGGGHLRRKKSKRVKRQYRKDLPLAKADEKRVKKILGMG